MNNQIFQSEKRLPIVFQSESSECGLACLAMVVGFFGHSVSLQELRREFSISMRGTTLKDISNISSSLNLSTRPISLDLDDMKKLSYLIYYIGNLIILLY